MELNNLFSSIPAETTQLLVVRPRGGSLGTLAFYERERGVWTLRLETPAHLGKNGVGKTREGDMKTPVGLFSLTTPFGILPDPGKDDGAGRPVQLGSYLRLTPDDYWCGQDGPLYNRLVSASGTPGYTPDDRDEHLICYAPAYHYACFIAYNEEGLPGRGSAIFLHCMGLGACTAGCVAIAEQPMRELLLTLAPGAKIAILDE